MPSAFDLARAVAAGLWSGITAFPAHHGARGGVRPAAGGALRAGGRPSGRPARPVRTFNRYDKATILRRAGGRCEHHGLIFGRCRQTERLESRPRAPAQSRRRRPRWPTGRRCAGTTTGPSGPASRTGGSCAPSNGAGSPTSRQACRDQSPVTPPGQLVPRNQPRRFHPLPGTPIRLADGRFGSGAAGARNCRTAAQRTSDNLCLLCDWHHDGSAAAVGHVVRRVGVPGVTPPPWLDPEQKRRLNQR